MLFRGSELCPLPWGVFSVVSGGSEPSPAPRTDGAVGAGVTRPCRAGLCPSIPSWAGEGLSLLSSDLTEASPVALEWIRWQRAEIRGEKEVVKGRIKQRIVLQGCRASGQLCLADGVGNPKNLVFSFGNTRAGVS